MGVIAAARRRAREALIDRLKSVLAARGGPESVYLFGSLARGDQHAGSDADILVVTDAPLDGALCAAIRDATARPTDILPVRPGAGPLPPDAVLLYSRV